MAVKYDTPDRDMPESCRKMVEDATGKVALKLRDHMEIPIEGNPSGGFPGLNLAKHKGNVVRARQTAIDKWNAANPNHELIPTPRPEVPILSPEEVETKKKNIKARKVEIDEAHNSHIEEALKEHPEEHHEGLREMLRHEKDAYGMDPQKYYDRRASEFHTMKEKGLDPHNLMHRYEHHKEMTANGTDTGD